MSTRQQYAPGMEAEGPKPPREAVRGFGARQPARALREMPALQTP